MILFERPRGGGIGASRLFREFKYLSSLALGFLPNNDMANDWQGFLNLSSDPTVIITLSCLQP